MDTSRFLFFYSTVGKIVKDIKKIEMSYMREYGLRSVHMGCLLHIKQNEKGMTVTQLANECKTDKALISRTIKELIDLGLVTTRTKGEDKVYKKKYLLTEESDRIVTDIYDDIANYICAARKGIAEEDVQTFYAVLSIFEKNISQLADEN